MMLKLSTSERTAIDVVLDRAVASSQSSTSAVGIAHAVDTSSIQRLLKLLGTLPVQEPSSDLVLRTLARIEQSTMRVDSTPSFISSLAAHPAQ